MLLDSGVDDGHRLKLWQGLNGLVAWGNLRGQRVCRWVLGLPTLLVLGQRLFQSMEELSTFRTATISSRVSAVAVGAIFV